MTPDTLQFTATVDIQAAETGRKPRISILAYNGGLITVQPFGRVAVDLAGMEVPNVIPLLADHSNTLDGIAGSGQPTIQGNTLVVEGTLSRNSTIGKRVIDLAGDGVPISASMGVVILQARHIRKGDDVTLNGRTFKADEPFLFVTKSRLREVSLVALGADNDTSVRIAASHNNLSPKEGTNMTEPLVNATADISDAERITKICATAGEYASKLEGAITFDKRDYANLHELQATALSEQWSPDRFRLACFENSLAKAPSGPGMQYRPASPPNLHVLEAATAMHFGMSADALQRHYPEQVLNAADSPNLHIRSLMDAAIACCQMTGQGHIDTRNPDAVIKAAFSTGALPTVLSNIQGKQVVDAYEDAVSDMKLIATVRSASSFHPQVQIRPQALDNLLEVAGDGEIKHTDYGEEDTYPWRLATFARMIAYDRQSIINDDVGYYDQKTERLAESAARTVLDLYYGTIIDGESNGHYSSANNNLLEAGSELSIDSLALAVQRLREQRDSRGNSISIRPHALVVSPKNETTARTLLNSTEIVTGESLTRPSGNPVRGIVPHLIVEPRLSNDDKVANADEDSWYLFGSPRSVAIITGYLNGKQNPTIETDEANFNLLGAQARCYIDVAIALADHRASLKATGAA